MRNILALTQFISRLTSPTAQYRNKNNLFLLTHFAAKFLFQTVTWNFSESGHGKSPADGVGGTVKSMADQLISYGTDIPNSEAFFTFH